MIRLSKDLWYFYYVLQLGGNVLNCIYTLLNRNLGAHSCLIHKTGGFAGSEHSMQKYKTRRILFRLQKQRADENTHRSVVSIRQRSISSCISVSKARAETVFPDSADHC